MDIELTRVRPAMPSHRSSIYSRPVSWSGLERLILDDGGPPTPLPIDRDIAARGGTTVALELTAASLQKAKTLRLGTPEGRRREMLWHEQEHLFFTRCFDIFRDLREVVRIVSYDLQTQRHFYPEVEPAHCPHLRAALKRLEKACDTAETAEQDAQNIYKLFWEQKPAEVWI